MLEMMTNFSIAIWLNIDMKKKMVEFLSANYIKHNHMLRKPAIREYTIIHLEGFPNIGERARQRASNEKMEVSEALIKMLKGRFISFEDPIFD